MQISDNYFAIYITSGAGYLDGKHWRLKKKKKEKQQPPIYQKPVPQFEYRKKERVKHYHKMARTHLFLI